MSEAERETLERLMHYLERKSAMKDAAAIRAVLEQNERLRAASRYRNTHDVRASRIDAALALHHESQTDAVPPDTICFECDCLWPCPTVKALEGKA